MGRTADYSRQSCAIAATLEIIGDPWTLLVIRDAFRGVRRFEQWQERLGVARNVLAARLRHEYVLTPKGKDLNTVLLTLFDWGAHHLYQGPECAGVAFKHKPCGHTLKPVLVCADCGEPVRPRDLEMILAPGPTVGEVLAREEEPRVEEPA
jgi:DNA-binding HxlR family transcriptional regulator